MQFTNFFGCLKSNISGYMSVCGVRSNALMLHRILLRMLHRDAPPNLIRTILTGGCFSNSSRISTGKMTCDMLANAKLTNCGI